MNIEEILRMINENKNIYIQVDSDKDPFLNALMLSFLLEMKIIQ